MSQQLQHFGLRLYQHAGANTHCELWVDHQPYLAVLREFEAAFAGDIAGAYQPGLSLSSLQQAHAMVTPFVCTCSAPDCWFINVHIELVQDTDATYVMWHQWRNPYRADKKRAAEGLYWDYSALPPLIFEQQQYLAEIARISAQVDA